MEQKNKLQVNPVQNLTINYIESTAMQAAKALNNVIFAEDTVIMPTYIDATLAYFKLGIFFQNLSINDVGYDDFCGRYMAGEFDEYMKVLENDRYALCFDKSVNSKIEQKKAQVSREKLAKAIASELKAALVESSLGNAATELLTTINTTLQKSVENFDKISSDDIQKFISSFADLSDEQSIVQAVLDSVKADKSAKSKKTVKKKEPMQIGTNTPTE
ncbi:MAG: hypothetical protein HDT43_01860 [Ruminococcaceae bacterium]|nr:hypothetical protein [Oscillospiraceae bacterium]